MEHQEKLSQYARLIVKTGANVQNDQLVLINCAVENFEFGRMVVAEAYQAGAKDVIVFWNDVKTSRLRYDNVSLEVLGEIPNWLAESRNYYAAQKAAVISIVGNDPEAYKGVDSEKLKANSKASAKAFEPYYKRMMNSEFQWCVVAVPERKWAQKVFPELGEQEAIEKLWDAIFEAVRIGQDDAVKAWNDHKTFLAQKCKILNTAHFDALHYQNSLGTDFTVGLQKDHIWEGGGEFTPEQIYFFANMPTEEIFTAPDRNRAEGKLVSSLPLSYQGNIIEHFSLTFHDGKVIAFEAEKGAEFLKNLIETDEGSHRLGEVALVPYDSPISNTGILFYDTLFDENASCHFALGECYPTNIKDGGKMTKAELIAAGGNQSDTHVDFMIGTKDLSITGITKEGQKVCIFKNGNWA
ncbi:aminopeptidase [Acetobacterium woodii]|uniref:Aminopeptidase II n=1 Tax=Acetobacterium woodii (strain ATCC 29683 / DSM 1030 / JCM 2381 / KCTC 1655 / WB1) TaxID=931626 RepID=H6LGJ6_ACEWD|nr:aminopeptidase [Acetobacterium woodii]AFA48324.1 aminopeptidase II [Acetobacterium woodii DSM 1030]